MCSLPLTTRPCRYLSLPRFDPDLPIRLTPVMKIATKYQVESVRERVVTLMHDSWPQSFEQWLSIHFELARIKGQHKKANGGPVGGNYLHQRIPEPCAAIRFARDYDIPSILPAAFYCLSGIPSNCNWEDPLKRTNNRERARWGLLDAFDLRRLVRLREVLASAIDFFTDEYQNPDISLPMMPQDCNQATTWLRGR